ncbi:uncharacterized protein WCC33_009300 [Rhinophrynus dorsalis]
MEESNIMFDASKFSQHQEIMRHTQEELNNVIFAGEPLDNMGLIKSSETYETVGMFLEGQHKEKVIRDLDQVDDESSVNGALSYKNEMVGKSDNRLFENAGSFQKKRPSQSETDVESDLSDDPQIHLESRGKHSLSQSELGATEIGKQDENVNCDLDLDTEDEGVISVGTKDQVDELDKETESEEEEESEVDVTLENIKYAKANDVGAYRKSPENELSGESKVKERVDGELKEIGKEGMESNNEEEEEEDMEEESEKEATENETDSIVIVVKNEKKWTTEELERDRKEINAEERDRFKEDGTEQEIKEIESSSEDEEDEMKESGRERLENKGGSILIVSEVKNEEKRAQKMEKHDTAESNEERETSEDGSVTSGEEAEGMIASLDGERDKRLVVGLRQEDSKRSKVQVCKETSGSEMCKRTQSKNEKEKDSMGEEEETDEDPEENMEEEEDSERERFLCEEEEEDEMSEDSEEEEKTDFQGREDKVSESYARNQMECKDKSLSRSSQPEGDMQANEDSCTRKEESTALEPDVTVTSQDPEIDEHTEIPKERPLWLRCLTACPLPDFCSKRDMQNQGKRCSEDCTMDMLQMIPIESGSLLLTQEAPPSPESRSADTESVPEDHFEDSKEETSQSENEVENQPSSDSEDDVHSFFD